LAGPVSAGKRPDAPEVARLSLLSREVLRLGLLMEKLSSSRCRGKFEGSEVVIDHVILTGEELKDRTVGDKV
jgi:hypothetical protein